MADPSTTPAADAPAPEAATTPAGDAEPTTTPDDLGDPGKKALDEERKTRREAERRAKDAETRLAELERSQLGDQERAIADAVTKATNEADERWRERTLNAEIKARASTLSLAPDLVAKLIDRKKIEWDGEDIDEAAMASEISRILADHPYLAKPGGDPPPPPPADPPPPDPKVSGGTRGAGEQADPSSMSMEEFRAWRKANT